MISNSSKKELKVLLPDVLLGVKMVTNAPCYADHTEGTLALPGPLAGLLGRESGKVKEGRENGKGREEARRGEEGEEMRGIGMG